MKTCVPIQLEKQTDVRKKMVEISKKADLAEIWLDYIKDLDLNTLLKNKPLPVLCVCKKSLDKGQFKGTYAEEADILIEAIKAGVDYIDIPLKMPEKLSLKITRHKNKFPKTKFIISYHNFNKALSLGELRKKVKQMQERGADIVKIAIKGNELKHSMDLIFLAKELEEKGQPHILINMGKTGVLTRVITPKLGGTFMFATLNNEMKTAEGQLSVDELKKYSEALVPSELI